MWYKKLWIKIKKYWWVFLIIIAGIFLIAFYGYNPQDIKELLQKKQEQADKELDALTKHSENIKEDSDENLEEYLKAIDDLEKNYKKDKEELDEKTKEKVKEFLKEAGKNPENVAKRIAEENGWEYVE